MFEHLGGQHVELEQTEVLETPTATHLRFWIGLSAQRGGLPDSRWLSRHWTSLPLVVAQ
jgi:hypothetical protein